MRSLIIGLLLSLLFVAAWHDIRSRRIPNTLVLPGAIAGLLLNAMLPHEMGGLGIFDSLAGLGLGLVLLLPPYLLRAMGAGDVKLMAMTGAFLGVKGVVGAFMYILLAGGLLALAMAWRQGNLSALLRKLGKPNKLGKQGAEPLRRDSSAGLESGNPGERGSTANPSPIVTNLPERPVKFDQLPEKFGQLPYGVAIAAGTAVWIMTVYG
jgi:prepilin peptidase CpaA